VDTATDRLTEQERDMLEEVSRELLWGHAQALAGRERISGTPAEREAVGSLRTQLDELGLTTTVYEVESLLGWPEAATLELLGPVSERVDAITHALAPSTPPDGLEADVVCIRGDEEEEFRQAAGRICLLPGIASPLKVLWGCRARAAALVFANQDADRVHEMCVSPVWGTPTTETAGLLPDLPVLSVRQADGERIRSLAGQGLRLRLRARTFRGWRSTPLLVGELRGPIDPDQFVLLSGHHCSWYRGAMDNGAANATMLEVARILARHRDRLQRSVRIAFWPGHTQGRYSGSTWYCDHFWEDLHDHCVLHVNADSTGARGAALYSASCMPETRAFAVAAIRDATGIVATPHRQSRAGDQSFWACGVPSVFMDLSQVPAELAAGASDLFGGGGAGPGLPWWWHTPEDTIDKLDPEVMERDTRVYLLATFRAAAAQVLPYRYRPAASEIREALEGYQQAAGDRLDLAPAIDRAIAAERAAAAVDGLLDRLPTPGPERAAKLNRALEAMDRELVLIAFTERGRFDQDLAVPIPPVPLLSPVSWLASLDPGSDESHFLTTELLRRRNQVCYQLRLAARAAQAALVAAEP
jgi:hypothetical protein